MTKIPFHKMSGSGNDFILIDNRRDILPMADVQAFASRICRRKISAGADGLILVEESSVADFRWRFYNSDGSPAEMCGNGARCVARFALMQGVCGPDMSFETAAGIVKAQVKDKQVKVTMPTPGDLILDDDIELKQGPLSVCSVNTGVPHVVMFCEDPDDQDVAALGREIRFHSRYAPEGTNVNFVSAPSGGSLRIRTYERGVEGETLSCGTGAVAAAVMSVCRYKTPSPVSVRTQSGEILTVYVQEEGGEITGACLEGGTRLVYEGALMEEAWQS